MAKQKSIITLEGTLGTINFYNRKGKPVARRAGGGFTSKAVKTSPTMVRVRENSSEFGLVSKAKKTIRLGLHAFLKDYKDETLHSRMMGLFQTLKALDTVSERGQRRFEHGLGTEAGQQLFLNFAITTTKASTVLPGKGVFDPSSSSYVISNLAPAKLVLPKGATGMQLCFGILAPSFADETFSFHSSPIVALDPTSTDTTLTLTPTSLPSGDSLRIAVLQVRYFQTVNGVSVLLHELDAQALEIVGVY
jgi:hypothetical protein